MPTFADRIHDEIATTTPDWRVFWSALRAAIDSEGFTPSPTVETAEDRQRAEETAETVRRAIERGRDRAGVPR